MQTTISIAAIILGAAAIVLGTVGIGTCRTTSDLVDTKVRSSDDQLAFRMPRADPHPPRVAGRRSRCAALGHSDSHEPTSP